MSTLEVRIEDVSGRESLLVTANLAEGWRRLRNGLGYFGVAEQEYRQDNRVTVRVWVMERSPESHPAEDGFPLEVQSMGSSPSKAVTFRLFSGRLSLGTRMSTMANSRRSGGKPGFYEDGILIARHGGVSYWLKFYAALNEEPEQDLGIDEEVHTDPELVPETPPPDIEQRLTHLFSAVDALEGRVGALGEVPVTTSLKVFQGTGAKQAQEWEKFTHQLQERWLQQFQQQVEEATKRLQEELKDLGEVIEEGKQQLASLAEAKLASLSQATQEVSAQQREEAIKEQHLAADAQVKSIQQAAEEAMAQLQATLQEQAESTLASLREEAKSTGQVIEDGKQQFASLAEIKAASLSQVTQEVSAQREEAIREQQVAADAQVKSIQQTAEEALASLREEAKSAGQVIEEGKQQLASLAEAKLALLSPLAQDASGEPTEQKVEEHAQAVQGATDAQVRCIRQAGEEAIAHLQNQLQAQAESAAKAAAGLEAEQKKLQAQCETARKDLEELFARRSANLNPSSPQPRHRGTVAMLVLSIGLFFAITVPLVCVYLATRPTMQLRLQTQAPADYIDDNPNWNAKRRAWEEEVAQAYWRLAVENVQEKYPFGSELPAGPPAEFQLDGNYDLPDDEWALTETRNYYWERLRTCWLQRECWVEVPGQKANWTTRLRQLWRQL